MGKYKVHVGDLYTANCGTQCKVVQRLSGSQVVIEWQDEFKHRQIARPERVMSGKVYNPYFKANCGVGYAGFGKYLPARDKEEYSIWSGMLERCYDSEYHIDKPTYADCTVCEEWHNFQNFAEWCQTQKGFKLQGYQLDKDLLVYGNRKYSPEACCFIPSYVNSLFSCSDSIRGDLPLGVTLGIYSKTKGQRYLAQVRAKKISNYGQRYLGSFGTISDAHKAWQVAKSKVIQDTLNIYSTEVAFNTSVAERLVDESWKLLYNAKLGIETKSFYGRN